MKVYNLRTEIKEEILCPFLK